ncbi:MAG: 50S ribosomal protein L21 [Pseudomonadota bacterium]
MFAVIKTGGKQYKVAADDVIKIEKLGLEPSDQVIFDEVLMVGGDAGVTVGSPLVDGASVVGELVDNKRDKKIIIFKKRRRQNSRRKNGHRQHFSVVKITDILTDGAKPKAAKKKAAPKKAEKPAEEAAPAAEAPKAKAAPKADAAPKAEAKKPAAKKAETKKADAPAADAPLFTAPDGAKDDLKKISGVGPVLEKKLNGLGITTYAQIAGFTADDIAKVDEALSFKGRIERDNWLQQAADLAKGE